MWIDGKRCDINHLPTIPIDFDEAKLTDVEGAREGRCIELRLPATPANDAIFGSSRDLYATKRFNMEHHTATIEMDGVQIFGGTIYLLSTNLDEKSGESYSVRINEGGAGWIDEVVHGSLSDLELPFEGLLNLVTISQSWEGDHPVRFFPIYRGDYRLHYGPSSNLPVEKILLSDDYHPFISIAEMVRAMFAKSGYTLRSNFLDSELGKSLYMSGEYSRTDNDYAKSKCDFFARRSEEGVATADHIGRVYASKSVTANSVGPIVDTADANALDSNGVRMSDTFNLNNAFHKNEAGNICFTPSTSVNVGFLLHLEYTTEYKILSRERLCGFDKMEGLHGAEVEIALANTCEDFRNATLPNIQYRALVFDHTEGREYQLDGTLINGITVVLNQWSSRSSLFVTPSKAVSNLSLHYRDSNNQGWIPYSGDWAIYSGFIEEQGTADVEMDFRLSPQEVGAGETLILDKFWFGGAEPGMKIVVKTGTSLRPYFTSVPGYNSAIGWQDIAPRNIRQSELLTALGEMFNLAFYTDRNRKEVYIEPLEDLYHRDNEVDWSNRIDLLSSIAISDAGVDLPQKFVLAYNDADLASHNFNLENDTTLGRWSFQNPLYGSKESEKRVGNTLFTTTLNISNILASAPSASILQVGDIGTESSFEESFSPRIVCYKGLRNLPKGESWGIGYRADSYPYAAFVDDEDINLCFESRNGIEGLNRYYLPMLLRRQESRRVTLALHLTTAEIATLLTSDGATPSLRRVFRLNIQGESVLFRLVKVERWDTESNIVQCTFEQELNN